MTTWRAVLGAVVLSSILAACSEKKKPKDDDEDDTPRKTATTASSSSSSESASPSASAAGSAEAEAGPPRPATAPADALLLSNEDRRVAVSIKPDGDTRVFCFTKDGTPIPADKASGKIRVATGKWVDLKSEKEALVTQIAKLEDGLTTVELALQIDGKDFNDAIAVPAGGTKALSEEPEIKIPEGTRGPNGGVVEVVGKQRIELVVDEKTDDIHVYFLNEKLEVMEIPKGTEITLNIDDSGKKKK